jgi:hypothetical protein
MFVFSSCICFLTELGVGAVVFAPDPFNSNTKK